MILITAGTVTGTARVVVDRLRGEGKKVGLVKLRVLRPFPVEELTEALKGAEAVGVLDKNISFGYEGTIFTNVNSALMARAMTPKTMNFIGGIGGRDITKENLIEAYDKLFGAAAGQPLERVQYMNVRCDY